MNWNTLTTSSCQFRDAVTEFAQKEVAPRAEEVDKTNTFPAVSTINLLTPASDSIISIGSLGEIRNHGSSWYYSVA